MDGPGFLLCPGEGGDPRDPLADLGELHLTSSQQRLGLRHHH